MKIGALIWTPFLWLTKSQLLFGGRIKPFDWSKLVRDVSVTQNPEYSTSFPGVPS